MKYFYTHQHPVFRNKDWKNNLTTKIHVTTAKGKAIKHPSIYVSGIRPKSFSTSSDGSATETITNNIINNTNTL